MTENTESIVRKRIFQHALLREIHKILISTVIDGCKSKWSECSFSDFDSKRGPTGLLSGLEKIFGRITASAVPGQKINFALSGEAQAALRRALALRATGRPRFADLRRRLPERFEAVRFKIALRDGFAFFFAILAISLSLSFSVSVLPKTFESQLLAAKKCAASLNLVLIAWPERGFRSPAANHE